MTRSKFMIGIPVLASMLVLTGCATTSDLNDVRAKAEQAQQSADEAKAMARDAKTSSDRAATEAAAARQAAEDTNRKLDEMFRRSMMK